MLLCLSVWFCFVLAKIWISAELVPIFFVLLSRRKSETAMKKEELMAMAIRLAEENIDTGGGPFGAVIARDGQVVATGVNRVTASCDPTAHAEVSAIRAAARALGTFDLHGCDIYSSCEPCPMCLSAIYWAHLDRVFYAGTKDDAARAGFDDAFIYHELATAPALRRLPAEPMMHAESLKVFSKWMTKEDKTIY